MISKKNGLYGLNIFFLFLTILMLSNCGFHLRGVTGVPKWLDQVAIIVPEGNAGLKSLLKEQLEAYHVRVTDDPTLANYWLTLENENFQQNISSISSSTTPRQYQLIYSIQFKLERAREYVLIPSNEIVISRQITINSNRILGSNDEENHQKHDMQHEALIQMIYRLSRIDTNHQIPDLSHGH